MDMLTAAEAQINCKNLQITNKTTGSIAAVTSPKLPHISTSLEPNFRKKLQELIRECSDIMSQSDSDVGHANLLEHEIHRTGPPVRIPYRRANPIRREIEKEIITKMEQNGIISESQSPYCTPPVLTFRKSGAPRLCTDFKKLNGVTKRDARA